MADYAKFGAACVYSKNSDYSSPKINTAIADLALTPDEYLHDEVECDTGGGTTVNLTRFATITCLLVKNNDATNYVTATFRSAGNSAVDNILRVSAGGWLMTTDVTAANNLVLAANGAAVECEVVVTGT